MNYAGSLRDLVTLKYSCGRTYKMYIVFYKINGEELSIRFASKTSAELFARRYNGTIEKAVTL